MFIKLTVANGTKPLKCLVDTDKFLYWEERRNFEGKEVGANGYESLAPGSGTISVLETVDEIAKMVAAAPELLEMLEGMYSACNVPYDKVPRAVKELRAILKAKGDQQ